MQKIMQKWQETGNSGRPLASFNGAGSPRMVIFDEQITVMAREIKSAADIPPPPPGSVNDYKDRLVKLIPSEIITAYVTLRGLINGAGEQGNRQLLLWIVFGILVLLNPLYLIYVMQVKKAGQVVFSSFAFILWVMVIGGTFTRILGFSAEYIGSILLVIYTLFIPFVYKG